MTEKDLLKSMLDMAATGMIGAFWWIANHFYQISKGEKFRWGLFLINAFLAFWVATIVWEFIPVEAAYRDWAIGISGFSSFPILKTFEQYGSKYITSKIWVWNDVK